MLPEKVSGNEAFFLSTNRANRIFSPVAQDYAPWYRAQSA
jgi:hypothetical protein